MLLSTIKPRDTVFIGEYLAALPADEDDMPPAPWRVFVGEVEIENSMCMLTGAAIPQGTTVYAPARGVTVHGRMPREGFPAVYCAHDYHILQFHNRAFFYTREVIEWLRVGGRYGGYDAPFDPIVFGTGELDAVLVYEPGKNDPGQVSVLSQSFADTRGPRVNRMAASMATLTELSAVVNVPHGFQDRYFIYKIIHHILELDRIRATLWLTVRQLPRHPGARLPPMPATLSEVDSPLPRGQHYGVIAEGPVVQSTIAWALRLDPRVRAVFTMRDTTLGDVVDDALPLDLPVVAFTQASEFHRFVNAEQPLGRMWKTPEARNNGEHWIGALCIGPGVLPVWTLDGEAQRFAYERVADANGEILNTVPRRVEIVADGASPVAHSVTSRSDLYGVLSGADVRDRARVTLVYDDDRKLVLRYRQCEAGTLYLQRVGDPVFDLPALQQQPSEVTLGIQLCWLPHDKVDTAAMWRRIQAGFAPVYGARGEPTGAVVDKAAEQARLYALLPRVAPYSDEPRDAPTERDHSQQHILYATPYAAPMLPVYVTRRL